MRICYLHYLYDEPLALLHVEQFAAAARELGHDVTVHAMNLAHSIAAAGNGSGTTVRDRLKQHLSRYLHEPKELLWNPRYLWRELALVRREKPDVLLVRDHLFTFAELGVRALSGVPLVYELNSPAFESHTYFDQYAHIPGVGPWTERLKMRRADAVVVVSRALRRYLIETQGVAAERVLSNPNGADCERFRPDIDPQRVRQRHGLGRRPVIGMVTSMKPWHGPELTRALVERLYALDIDLLFVGGGPGWDAFRNWAQQRGLNDRITITGSIAHQDVPEHVAAMDVALMSESNVYGSPLKIIEYMAAGRAIVAPRYEPIEEVIVHEQHGLLFARRDVDEAAHCIRRLLEDADLRRRLGQQARARAESELSWRHNAERVLGACRDAIARRKGER